MKRKRRKHSRAFKARVALEAIKGLETINQIAAKYEIHPVQVSNWKKQLLENVEDVFGRKSGKQDKDNERERAMLERKVGQLSMEVDWLEKKCDQLGIGGKGRNS